MSGTGTATGKPQDGVIVYDPRLCTGCRYCELACSVWHTGRIEIGKSRLRILFSESGPDRFAAVNCQHCDDPLCAAVCPSETIRKDAATGWVLLHAATCIGCEMCVLACPLAVPYFDQALKVAAKCDFCYGDPECVKHCSSGALRIVPKSEALTMNEAQYLSAKE